MGWRRLVTSTEVWSDVVTRTHVDIVVLLLLLLQFCIIIVVITIPVLVAATKPPADDIAGVQLIIKII